MSNHPLSQLLARLEAERRVWVRAAVVQIDTAWSIALLELTLGAPPPTWRRTQWRYPRAIFSSSTPKGTTVAGLLLRGRLPLRPPTTVFSIGDWVNREWRESRFVGIYEPLEWPSIVWTARFANETGQVLHGELVARGAPAFLSFDEAALAFFGVPRSPNRRFGSSELVVREQRLAARIDGVRIRPTEVFVAVSGNVMGGATVTLGGDGGPSKRLTARSHEVRLPLVSPLGTGSWVALHRDEELLDQRILDPSWRALDVEFELEPQTRVEVLLSRGEGPEIEFKQQLPDSDPRGAMKTVSAFANGGGGVILFGVSDEGAILGLKDQDLRKAVDRLTTLIGDHVRPRVHFAPELVTINDMPVLAVTVDPGQEPPYGVGTSDRNLVYYVRRGATSSPASPAEIRAFVRAGMPMPATRG